MILKTIRVSSLAVLLAGAGAVVAQNAPATQAPNIVVQPSTPEANAPQKPSDEKPEAAAPVVATPTKPADKAAAYSHFMMAHIYEEMVSMYGRSDFANKAIDEYRAAI